MDEVQDSTLSEEINRLHAEHHRYAQRLEELLQKPYLSDGRTARGSAPEEAETARQRPDLCPGAPVAGCRIGREQFKQAMLERRSCGRRMV